MDMTALWLTLELASASAGILLIVGIPLASWLAGTRSRVGFVVETLIAMPLVLPPTVLGFYLLVAMSPNGRLGGLYESVTGRRLAFSFSGILLASVIYNLPFAVRPFTAAFRSVDRRLVEASWCLGVSRIRTFLRISLPLAFPGVLAGFVLTFAHAMGEFGVVLMVGGNIPGITRTLSIAIYDDVQALNYEAAGQTALVLVAFSFVVLLLVSLLGRKGLPL
jgi:molybdate transport system permease protein